MLMKSGVLLRSQTGKLPLCLLEGLFVCFQCTVLPSGVEHRVYPSSKLDKYL